MQSICWPDYFRRIELNNGERFWVCDGPHSLDCLTNQHEGSPGPGSWAVAEMKLVSIENGGAAVRLTSCPVEGNERIVFYVMLPQGVSRWEPLREAP